MSAHFETAGSRSELQPGVEDPRSPASPPSYGRLISTVTRDPATRQRRRRIRTLAVGVAAVLAASIPAGVADAAGGAGQREPGVAGVITPGETVPEMSRPSHPASNRTPVVGFDGLCHTSPAAAAGAACRHALVADIDAARAQEHVRTLTLPRDYARLPARQQVFVLTNLERVDRAMAPVAGINAELNARAQLGADGQTDPSPAGWQLDGLSGLVWTSVQATASNALEADWLWMYSDGWAGAATTNLDCTGPRSTGCWGHRENILRAYPTPSVLVTGTAAAAQTATTVSYAQLVLAGTGRAPRLLYTWRRAVADGADRR